MTRKIDHIVYCVHNLETAILDLESRLGVKANIGGRHTTQGTKNALINLNNNCYLEILAIDKSNKEVKGPRWMGIDQLQSPKITRWALKSVDINTDSLLLSEFNNLMGRVREGSRKKEDGKTLNWQIAMPLSSPEVEIVPFITDWTKSQSHPTEDLQQNCELLELRLKHPNPSKIKNLFSKMNIDLDITTSDTASIEITLRCPKGIIQL